jgi:putative transposase
VVVTVPAPAVEPTDQVVGVDLGLNRPAVTSNNRFLGQRRWKAIEGRYFKRMRALQKKGTKSAKRHLRKIKRRRARFRNDADHVLSKQIVAAAEIGATIVLENLCAEHFVQHFLDRLRFTIDSTETVFYFGLA